MEEKEFLAHHGILGQKWGIRRYQNSDGSLTEEGKQRYIHGYQKWKASDASKLSDEELRVRINRLQQESTYKRLVKELDAPEAVKKRSHPLLKQIFVSSAATAMSTVVTSLATQAIQNKVAKHIFKDEERLKKFEENKAMREAIFKSEKKKK